MSADIIRKSTANERHEAYMSGELELKGKELDEIEHRQGQLLKEFMLTRGKKSRLNLLNRYRTKYGMPELDELVNEEARTIAHAKYGMSTVACSHEFVNIRFTTRQMVCKHCDQEE